MAQWLRSLAAPSEDPGFQYPHSGSKLSVSPVTKDLTLFSVLHEHYMQAEHPYSYNENKSSQVVMAAHAFNPSI